MGAPITLPYTPSIHQHTSISTQHPGSATRQWSYPLPLLKPPWRPSPPPPRHARPAGLPVQAPPHISQYILMNTLFTITGHVHCCCQLSLPWSPLGCSRGDVRVMLHPTSPLPDCSTPTPTSLPSFFQLTSMCLSLCFPAASLGTGACAEWTRLCCGSAAPCGSHPAVRSVAWRLGGLGIGSCCISCCLSCALHAAYLPSHSG
jgi:hypothetical protein